MKLKFRPKDYPKEYLPFRHIKSRCLNPNNKDYHKYGAKGIKVQDSFLLPNGEGFSNFMECIDIKPEDKKSVDRINTYGNYDIQYSGVCFRISKDWFNWKRLFKTFKILC